MKKIKQKDYDSLPSNYRGTYSDPLGIYPEFKGKRTMLVDAAGMQFMEIESVHFEIV